MSDGPDYERPHCPICGGEMMETVEERGDNWFGDGFWYCLTPGCEGTYDEDDEEAHL